MVLPTELYRPIIQHITTRGDLHRLLFVSRTVSYETESVLYQTIEINHRTVRMPLSMELLLHLARCYRVARYVRELNICGPITSASLTEAGILSPDQHLHTLNQALCAVKNLRVLSVLIYIITPQHPSGTPLTSSIFSNCTFKLEVFRLGRYSGKRLPHLDLSQVKELSLGGVIPTFNISILSPDTLPSLRILSCSWFQLLEFRPYNDALQIRALELFYSADLALDLFYSGGLAFGPEFPNITSLKLPFMLDRLIHSFPSLRYLHAHLGKIEQDLPILVDRLSILKGLEKLCLINAYGIVYPADPHVKLFSAIPNLQELDIAEKSDTRGLGITEALEVSKRRKAERWNRNDKNCRSVLVDVVSEWKDTRWLQ